MEYYSYAKINLFLDVVSLYKNGYHGIRSIFIPISLADKIEYKRNELGEIRVFDSKNLIPHDNLLTRAASALTALEKKIPFGIDFYLDKRIPIGGGLGGGSSNAAAVLKILNREWGCAYSPARLAEIGAKIGADVPFFIRGGVSRVTGIGEMLKPLPRPNFELNALLVFPQVKMETPLAYRLIDEKGLCRDSYKNKKKFRDIQRALRNSDLELFLNSVYNKFEEVVFEHYEELPQIKGGLLKSGALQSFMSGSGSTIVGIFSDIKYLQKSIDLFEEKGYKTSSIKLFNFPTNN